MNEPVGSRIYTNSATVMCERCNNTPKRPGERYCMFCRLDLIAEMELTGYLEKLPPAEQRSKDARENVRQTKFGID